jgi:putative ABC transport system ATP-binding protein
LIAEAQPADFEADVEQVVGLTGLRFGWEPSRPVLDIEGFELAPSERVFLAGASGSGKSTLLNLLGGVIRPDAGSVVILGQDITALPDRRVDRFRADHIGFVFQMFNLVPYLSTLENVLLPCRFSARRAARARRRSGSLEADARRLLEGLELSDESVHARNVTALSIGQQQRVAVARALIGSPELLIADEPTSALDEGTRERFVELLFAECRLRGTTVLLVSHDARLGALFDRQVQLSCLNRAGAGA